MKPRFKEEEESGYKGYRQKQKGEVLGGTVQEIQHMTECPGKR